METKQLCEEYISLTKQISVLDARKKEIAPQITENMEADKLSSVEEPFGTVTLIERTSYDYTEKVDNKKNELKELKKSEEESGVAKKKIAKFLRATPTKEVSKRSII